MPLDWLVVWGVTQVTGKLVWPVMQSFAQDVANDVAKDYVKGCFGSVFSPLTKEPLQKALGKALKKLLTLIEDELLDTGLQAQFVKDWIDPLKRFVRSQPTQAALRQAFSTSDAQVDARLLAQAWEPFIREHPLTDDFSWQRIAKRFSRAVSKLREEDKELREILAAQALPEIADAAKRAAGLPPKSDLNGYREALMERYANLHFDTLDTTGAYETQRKLWNVFVAQTVRDCQEYRPQDMEIPKEHQRRLREQGEWGAAELAEEMLERRRRNYLDQVPRSVLEAVQDDRLPRLVILGDPGAGKSSLLRYLALEWARMPDATARELAPLPLLIELREYNHWECPHGKSFIRYLHDAQNWYRLDQFQLDRRLAQRDGAVLLLDGLDEIFDPQRRELAVNDLTRFSNEYPNVRIVVTSRVIGYKQQRLSDAEFRHLMLQDLDEPQINDFLERWHNETFSPDRTDREAKKARLRESINSRPPIRELAGNPLLLTMMAILNRHQELPRDRAQLYGQAARVLLHEWDVEKNLAHHPELKGLIGHTEKVEMLRDVAYFMQSNAKGQVGNIIARSELERLLRTYLQNTLGLLPAQAIAHAKALVEQLRERNFILCYLGADSYAFVHRTFLEYFCALAIVREFRNRMTLDYLKEEVFGPHWHDETWHEVLCLIAGLVAETSVKQVAELIDFLLAQKDQNHQFHHIFLAAQCYQEVRNPQTINDIRQKLQKELTDLLEFDLPSHDDDVLEDEEIEKRDLIHAKAVSTLVRVRLIENTMAWLKTCATQGYYEAVRRAALQEIARGWLNDFDTLILLKTCAIQDKSSIVREAALQEIARGWHAHPDTLPWLKTRVTQDDLVMLFIYNLGANGVKQPYPVRQVALQEIARGWPSLPDTLLFLKDCAAPNSNWSVRQTAMQELGRRWRNHPDTLPILKDHATQDSDWSVRQAAVQELARGWKELPDTLPLLKARAYEDDDYPVRQTALHELVRGWPDDPDTLPMLKVCATQDRSSFVRQAAVQELMHGWKDDPEVQNWLKQIESEESES